MLLFKRNLLPVESNVTYLFTNVIGAILLMVGLGLKKSAFNYVVLGYIGLNVVMHLMNSYEVTAIRAASGLILFIYCLIFVFPFVATLFYQNIHPVESPFSDKILKTVQVSLILAISTSFVLITGFFLSFSLLFVITGVVVTQVLLFIALLILLIHYIKLIKAVK